MKEAIGAILEREGFIEKSRIDRSGKFPILRLSLSPKRNRLSLKRVSRPGRRVYRSAEEIRPVQNGFGIAIISTSAGLRSDAEARKEKRGEKCFVKFLNFFLLFFPCHELENNRFFFPTGRNFHYRWSHYCKGKKGELTLHIILTCW